MYNCNQHGWSSHYVLCPSCAKTKSYGDITLNTHIKNSENSCLVNSVEYNSLKLENSQMREALQMVKKALEQGKLNPSSVSNLLKNLNILLENKND
jgi:hypothetical protein